LQTDLFVNLNDKGLFRIMNGLKEHPTPGKILLHYIIINYVILIEIRKLYFKLFINMIYNNETVQNLICDKFHFSPIGSIICINWIPDYLLMHTTFDQSKLI